jgi:hypothetical protein
VTELEQRVESLLYRDLARIAGDTLEDGWDFVLFMPRLADVLDDDGIPDPEKIAVRAEQLAEWKPGLRKGARVPTPSFGQAAGRQSTMTAVPPGARCCAGLTEDAPGRPLASIHRWAESRGWAREREDALLTWEDRTCLGSVSPVQEGHLAGATFSYPPGGVSDVR